MATHDYIISNGTGAAVRADLNNALAAIVSNNSNSSAPSTTYAYQFWADTGNNVLKIRNSANDAFIELFQLDGTLTLEDGSASTPALAFRDDLNTGIFSSAADKFNIATGGVERMELGTATIFNEDGADVDFRIEGDTETNLFYLDASTNRIGIGISSPATLLHLSASSPKMRFTDEDTAVDHILNADSSVGNFAIDVDANSESSEPSFIVNVKGGEKLRLESSGRLGIGTTDPSTMLEIASNADAQTTAAIPAVRLTNTDGAAAAADIMGSFEYLTKDTSDPDHITAFMRCMSLSGAGVNFDLAFGTKSSDVAGDATEKMRLLSNGNLGIGISTPDSKLQVGANDFDGTGASDTAMAKIASTSSEAFVLGLVERGGQGLGISCRIDGAGSSTTAINFMDGPALTSVGTVTCTSTATAYNQSGSDRTLKKNFENWTDTVLTSFKNLNPQKFNFIHEDDTAAKHKGYIAQDLVADFPEAYPKSPDTEKYMYNPSGMVVYLMKAIQELEAKVAALEAA